MKLPWLESTDTQAALTFPVLNRMDAGSEQHRRWLPFGRLSAGSEARDASVSSGPAVLCGLPLKPAPLPHLILYPSQSPLYTKHPELPRLLPFLAQLLTFPPFAASNQPFPSLTGPRFLFLAFLFSWNTFRHQRTLKLIVGHNQLPLRLSLTAR